MKAAPQGEKRGLYLKTGIKIQVPDFTLRNPVYPAVNIAFLGFWFLDIGP
jgi:hypothetical protein